MLTLHLEALTHTELVNLAARTLGFVINVPAAAPEPKGTTSEAAAAPASPSAPASEPSVPALPPMPGKGPGRPRKPKQTFDNLPAPSEAPAQPAVASNTGSAPAVNPTPAAGLANTEAAGGGTSAPAAPTLTAEQMRKSFGRILDKLPGDEGFAAASKILAELGYQKITEVKPEHYNAVVAATDALLAA